MEKIRIKTAGSFELTAWKDKIQFIVLADLLAAMQVEFVEEVIEYIKQDKTWFVCVRKMELPGIGEKEVIQLTRALGLIQWLPESVVGFIQRDEVFTALVVHLESYMEFFQWKLEKVEKCIDDIQRSQKEVDQSKENTIEQQDQLIEILKKALNLKTSMQ